MNVPEDLKYSKDHEWIRIDGENAYIGITDFAQGELGDIVFVELPDLLTSVNSGNPIATIEAVKTVADLYMPIDGEIVKINQNLESEPESINHDAYNNGWIAKIQISNSGELDNLMNSKAYDTMLTEE